MRRPIGWGRGFWLCWSGLALVAAVEGRAAPEGVVLDPARSLTVRVVAGGRNLALEPAWDQMAAGDERETVYRGITLTQGELPLELWLQPTPEGVPPWVRLRTRMEGREAEWQDHESMMWVVWRFLDEANRAVSSAAFARRGESPGWAGLPQQSRFTWRVDKATVPERACKVQLLLVSGGTPRTTGFWAVRRLRLSASEGANAPVPRYQLEQLRGTPLDSPQGIPEGWTRDGTSLQTPRLYLHSGEEGKIEPMLALVDVDPTNTGGWLQAVRDATPVTPGQTLQVECEEMYSIGRGGEATVPFRTLPVGHYLFRAQATDELGRPTGPALRLPVEVRPPFYGLLWVRMVAAGLVLGASLAMVRYLTWRKVQRELQRLERRRAVEEERTRLARDIHDEMGARLTQISLLAARALRETAAAGPAEAPVRQIHGAVRELAAALDEIVWAADPVHDTLEGLAHYLSQYAGTVLREAGVRCRLEIPALLPPRMLSSGTRHRLMMAVKEAITNALKHAAASEVRLELALEGADAATLRITVADNGAGFVPTAVARGHGLDNLHSRLAELGGGCTLDSAPGAGTRVVLRLPLPATEEAT